MENFGVKVKAQGGRNLRTFFRMGKEPRSALSVFPERASNRVLSYHLVIQSKPLRTIWGI